jgi:hypothetical protein
MLTTHSFERRRQQSEHVLIRSVAVIARPRQHAAALRGRTPRDRVGSLAQRQSQHELAALNVVLREGGGIGPDSNTIINMTDK